MPVLRGSPRACGVAVERGASSSSLKSMRPHEEQVWIVLARRTCCTWEIGSLMPHTAQQPLTIGDMTMWSFLYRRW